MLSVCSARDHRYHQSVSWSS